MRDDDDSFSDEEIETEELDKGEELKAQEII